jgi:hypothetical protein
MLAVCTQSHVMPVRLGNAHLICMVICPTRAVSYVEITATGQSIVFAEQDLLCNEPWGAKRILIDLQLRSSQEA